MSDEPKVRVRITARQEIQFSQVRDVPKSVWDKYEAMCAKSENYDDDDFNREFGHWIDESDVTDAEEYEDLEINLAPEKAA